MTTAPTVDTRPFVERQRLVEEALAMQIKLYDATSGYAAAASAPNWRAVEVAFREVVAAHAALVAARGRR